MLLLNIATVKQKNTEVFRVNIQFRLHMSNRHKAFSYPYTCAICEKHYSTKRKENHMLFTKCIIHVPSHDDGIRISVMSRHTQNDGSTPDERITQWDIHAPILGPSPRLIGDYYKRGLSWDEFADRYLNEIRTERKLILIKLIGQIALVNNVTLLCIEETQHLCHRSLLAGECKRVVPELQIIHR